jgi:hypothetical protein
MEAEGPLTEGFYGASTAAELPCLPLGQSLAECCGEQKEVLLHITRSAEARKNTLRIVGFDGEKTVTMCDVEATCVGMRGARKPRQYGRELKRLIHETGRPERFCRQCFNCSGYDFATALAAINALRNE